MRALKDISTAQATRIDSSREAYLSTEVLRHLAEKSVLNAESLERSEVLRRIVQSYILLFCEAHRNLRISEHFKVQWVQDSFQELITLRHQLAHPTLKEIDKSLLLSTALAVSSKTRTYASFYLILGGSSEELLETKEQAAVVLEEIFGGVRV